MDIAGSVTGSFISPVLVTLQYLEDYRRHHDQVLQRGRSSDPSTEICCMELYTTKAGLRASELIV